MNAAFLVIVLFSASPSTSTEEQARTTEIPRTSVVFSGCVVGPEGAPREGVLVLSSAGGRALSDARGNYRLESPVPLDAESVELTAFVSGPQGNLVASARAAVPAVGASTSTILFLTQAGCSQGGWVPTFGGLPGVGGDVPEVRALAVFDDGNGPALYVGGDFTLAGGVNANHIAKWDGSRWSALGSGLNGIVRTLAVFDDGSGPALYVGGDFITAGGAPANHIARWTGSAWATAGGLGVCAALTVFDDGNGPALYCGGFFSRVRRWGGSGSGWVPLPGTLDGTCLTLTSFDDGTGNALYAGGSFTTAGGVTVNNVARWDGTSWSALGAGRNGTVLALATYDDGSGPKLFAGGRFTEGIWDETGPYLSRWDGTSWSEPGRRFDGEVNCLWVHDDGSGPLLFAGGDIALAHWDGFHWIEVPGGGSRNYAMATFDEGQGPALFLDGLFSHGIERWKDSSFSLLGDGLDRTVLTLVAFDDGGGPELLAGGQFTTRGATGVSQLARWDGSTWAPLGSGWSLTGFVNELIDFDDGNGPALYAGGNAFRVVGVAGTNNIAKWDGAAWSALGSGLGSPASGGVHALAIFDDGGGPALYAGGVFTTSGGMAASNIARWDGASWSQLSGGVGGSVRDMVVFDDGGGPALYVGGMFTTAGGMAASNIARWDGVSWSMLGSGMDSLVLALAVFDDGSGPALYAGGVFTTAGGVPASHTARWDGTSWSALGTGVNDTVTCLAAFDDGIGPTLVAGGGFTTAGGLAVNCIARWDGSAWSALGGGTSSSPRALLSFPLGGSPALYVGGEFEIALDSGDAYLARWQGDVEPPLITAPDSIHVKDHDGMPGEVVSYVVTASDPCDSSPSLVCTPPSGSVFPPGRTLVTCTATDAAGNQAVRRFPVYVGTVQRSR